MKEVTIYKTHNATTSTIEENTERVPQFTQLQTFSKVNKQIKQGQGATAFPHVTSMLFLAFQFE
jgi:hypothetical protein